MEVLTERLTKGTLQHLQRLEEQADELSQEGESRVKQERTLRALQKAVHQLQERRDLLKVQIANSPNKVLGPILQNVQSKDKDSLSAAVQESIQGPADRKVLHQAVTEALQLKERELSASYRLTGCTVHKTDNDCIRVRWDTFDSGEYFQPYYAIVAMNKDESLHLTKHNLPYFMPLKKIVSEHLNTDLQRFVQEVGDFLNALVSRKQQVSEAQEKRTRNIRGKIVSSNAFDTIGLTLSSRRLAASTLDIKLIYDDLWKDRPTRVLMESANADIRQEFGAIRDTFLGERLADAIATVFEQ
ncbi:centromere protein O-like [Diadema antillarum]|uniref:centromere protein O-like n=1 Tax=Diadema antillarum TaxID=105358 RepID=UPI003A8962CF